MKLKIFTDGGSRGNPGQAAIGVVIYNQKDGKKISEISECIGVATNNIAEYSAVLAALAWIENNLTGKFEFDFFLDSELVVRQLSGVYKVKDEKLKSIFLEIINKISFLGSESKFTHVTRDKNIDADALVNKALDENIC